MRNAHAGRVGRRAVALRRALTLIAVIAGCSAEEEPANPGGSAHADAGAEVASDARLDADAQLDADAAGDAKPDAALTPTPPSSLTDGPGKNEDPSLWIGADGTFNVAVFSSRSGDDEIWVSDSRNALDWSPFSVVTTPPEHDFYPSVILGKDGTLHMVWFRGVAGPGGALFGSVWYRDGSGSKTWSSPKALTGASELNWTPTIAEDTSGQLWVAWASRRFGDMDCLLVSSDDGGATWSDPPTRATDGTAHDDFPFVYARSDGSLLLAWARYALTEPDPFSAPSSEIVYSTSSDGRTWTPAQPLTADGTTKFVDTLPDIFPSADPSGVSIAWTSNRDDPYGEIYAVGLSQAPNAAAAARLTNNPGQDYSPRLVPAGPPGLYLMAWVSSRNGSTNGEDLDVFKQLVEIP